MNPELFVEDDDEYQSGQGIDLINFKSKRGELKRIINKTGSENLPNMLQNQ